MVAPLDLIDFSVFFTWSPEAAAAFSRLKSLLMLALVLVQPDPALQFIVEVDTSNTRVGAVLSQ